MVKRIRITSLGFWLTVLVMLAACNVYVRSQSTPTPGPVEANSAAITSTLILENDKILRLLYWQAPTTLNPHLSSASPDWAASRITFEPLASYDQDGNLVPFLAAEIPSLENGGLAEDGKSVTWKLRPGVKWSDGEPFTADDVLFTFQFVSNPEVGAKSKSTYEAVEGVEVIDDQTVKVNFRDVNPGWSLPFVGPTGMILPRHIYQDANGPDAAGVSATVLPVGTGPYRVLPPGIKTQEVLFLGSELVDTNKIVYEPNPFFRESDKPFFSRVEFRGGGTVKEAARLALQTGETDFAWNLQVDSETLAQLEEAGKGIAVPILGSFVERIYFNFTDPNPTSTSEERSGLKTNHPFFSDIKVCQAFSYAIDREAIAALYGKAGSPSRNILVSPANYDSPNTSYEFNLEKANSLLDEAGWQDNNGDGIRDKNGKKMKILFQTSANSLRQQTQKIIQKSLQSVGVEVELKVIDSSSFFDSDPANPNTAYHFYADLQMYNDGNPSPDPGSYMQYLTSAQIPQESNDWTGENVGRWQNPDYDALYQQSTTEIDLDQRAQLLIQMNDLVINNFAVIPLVHRARVIGVSNTLAGIDPTPWDAELWNIKDWRRASP
jgi:peptide/nickel transport system substrate-binding protein